MKPLKDILGPGLKVVFCGMAAGIKSAKKGAYYAGPGNKFYDTLCRIGLTDHKLNPNEFEELLGYGIGLTDLVKGQAGSDRNIHASDIDRNNLTRKISECKPKVLAFNGKKVAKEYLQKKNVEYGLQCELIGKTIIFILPSTSGSAGRWWNIKFWKELALKYDP